VAICNCSICALKTQHFRFHSPGRAYSELLCGGDSLTPVSDLVPGEANHPVLQDMRYMHALRSAKQPRRHRVDHRRPSSWERLQALRLGSTDGMKLAGMPTHGYSDCFHDAPSGWQELICSKSESSCHCFPQAVPHDFKFEPLGESLPVHHGSGPSPSCIGSCPAVSGRPTLT